jgi:hypothetical protein
MATNDKTIDRLQYLEILYRQGYRSDVIDRSLDKIIALERAAAQHDLADVQERLRTFETRYQMPSEEFYRRFRAGELGDAMDVVEWSIFYEMWESVRARLERLETDLVLPAGITQRVPPAVMSRTWQAIWFSCMSTAWVSDADCVHQNRS